MALSATCTVTAGARLAEALRKSRDVNEPEVSSDMALCAAGTQFCGASRVCARRVAQGGIEPRVSQKKSREPRTRSAMEFWTVKAVATLRNHAVV